MNKLINSPLRPFWLKYFNFNWQLGIALILLFGIPRFIIVLRSYVTHSYMAVMFIFMIMWCVPLILLNKTGRKEIGIKKPAKLMPLLIAFISGIASCAIIFSLFNILYGNSIHNAFVYISGNNPGASIASNDKWIYFIIAVIPSMIFSPIGEEFLYRGVIHDCFSTRMNNTKASYCDSLAFALTHIAHFGIIWNMGVWQFSLLPSLLWIASMFGVSQVFYHCKQYSGNIWGAVIAHSGFNAAMMYGIFYIL